MPVRIVPKNRRTPVNEERAMRLSRYPFNTVKETPAEAEVVSHKLMLRAGIIRRLASGLYSWLPMGLRTLHKVEQIITFIGLLLMIAGVMVGLDAWATIPPVAAEVVKSIRKHG